MDDSPLTGASGRNMAPRNVERRPQAAAVPMRPRVTPPAGRQLISLEERYGPPRRRSPVALAKHRRYPSEPFRLLDLPAEMRNEIYELAFTRETGKGPINLRTASPPSCALLRTCRQVYNETKKLFRHAVRRYYNDEHFFFDLHQKYRPREDLIEIAQRFDLQSMRNIRVFFGTTRGKVYEIKLQPDRKSLSLIEKAEKAHQPDYFCGFRICVTQGLKESIPRFASMTEEDRDEEMERYPRGIIREHLVTRVQDQLNIILAKVSTPPWREIYFDRRRRPIPVPAYVANSKPRHEWPEYDRLGRRPRDLFVGTPNEVLFR